MQRFTPSRLGVLASLAAASMAGAACETAVAPVEIPPISLAVVENSRNEFVFFIPPCNGEPIDGSGIFHLKVSSTVTPSGRVNGTFHINAKGKGVGQITGANYEWNDAINESFGFDADFAPFHDTFIRRFRLIGQGGVPDRRFNVTFHITVNANGEVTSFKFEISDTCPEAGPIP
jgi:hypothetical protein